MIQRWEIYASIRSPWLGGVAGYYDSEGAGAFVFSLMALAGGDFYSFAWMDDEIVIFDV